MLRAAPMLIALVIVLLCGAPAAAMPADPPAMAASSGPSRPAALPGATGWTSGWQPIDPGETLTLTHNLGGSVEDYVVQLEFLDLPLAGGKGINIYGYGGLERDWDYYGAYWLNLTSTTIQVARLVNDGAADRVRVWIWKPDLAQQACSGWLEVAPNSINGIQHNLGGSVDDYVVWMWFKDAMSGAIHQYGYGGMDDIGSNTGAYWRSLDTTELVVDRPAGDLYADQVRVCVGVPADAPVYDSDWLPIDTGTTVTVTHAVGGNPNSYVVQLDFRDDEGSYGIHQVGLGGNTLDLGGEPPTISKQGAYWQNLTNNSVQVVREPHDPYIDRFRLRIWQQQHEVFLPLAVRK